VNAIDYIKLQTEASLGYLKTAADGMTDEQYNLAGPGTCNPAAKSHVHALTAIDFFVVNRASGGDMLWPAFASKAGLPADSRAIWDYTGTIPLAAVQEFAEQMKAASLNYIGTLKDGDLDRKVDTMIFGEQTVGYLLNLGPMHAVSHAGDVAAARGAQGLKGLPF
jgi:hypothetical protein